MTTFQRYCSSGNVCYVGNRIVHLVFARIFLFYLLIFPAEIIAGERLALLIGNKAYSDKVGALKNPHNDINIVGAALEQLRFKVTKVRDADFVTLQKSIRSHIARVQESGADTISRSEERRVGKECRL